MHVLNAMTQKFWIALYSHKAMYGLFASVSVLSFSKPSSRLNSYHKLCLLRSNLNAHSVLLSSPGLTGDLLGHGGFKSSPMMQVTFNEQDSELWLPGSPLSEILSYSLASVFAWTLESDLSGQKDQVSHHSLMSYMLSAYAIFTL